MNKKRDKKQIWLALVTLMSMLTMLAAAPLAHAAPSKTTGDTSAVLGAYDESVTFEIVEMTEFATEILGEISAFAAGNPVIGFFDEAVRNAIAALLPAGFDLNTLVMNEFLMVAASGYELGTGDVEKLFLFATAYPDGAVLVALVGIVNGPDVTWVPLKAEVADGWVKIHFTQDVLSAINGRAFLLAILSEDTSRQ